MDNGLTSTDFGRLLIGAFSKIQAAQEIQANMLAGIMAQGSHEKKEKIMQLYFSDVDNLAKETYQNFVSWLNDAAKKD